MSPQEFIGALAPGTVASFPATGIFPSAIIAQGAVESAWGAKAPGNNLFGIKADAGWNGATVEVPTHEVVHGVRQAVTCRFRAYESWADCMLDHAKFFHANPRYAAALQCKTGPDFAMAIAAAGYATAPGYGETICAVIKAHNLTQYDKETTWTTK